MRHFFDRLTSPELPGRFSFVFHLFGGGQKLAAGQFHGGGQLVEDGYRGAADSQLDFAQMAAVDSCQAAEHFLGQMPLFPAYLDGFSENLRIHAALPLDNYFTGKYNQN